MKQKLRLALIAASFITGNAFAQSTITGHVFNDANNNLSYDATEGLSGVMVWLFDVNGIAPNYLIYPLKGAVTGANGVYTFSGVMPGDYQVRVRPSTMPTSPAALPRTVVDHNTYTPDAYANGITVINGISGSGTYSNIDFGFAVNVAAPAFASTDNFAWNAAHSFNAAQNGQLAGTYNLKTRTIGGSSFTPTITWKQDRNTQPPGYADQWPAASYAGSGQIAVDFPGSLKGGIHTTDSTYTIISGDFGDYDVYPANNNRTTTSISFSRTVINTRFSVYDVDNADPIRRGGRIDHVTVTGYNEGVAVIPVITNPSATPWNNINSNMITGWADYDTSNNSFSYNAGNDDKAAANVYFASAIDSIAVQYEDYAPVLIGAKGLLHDGDQAHDTSWYPRVPEGRGISIGSVDYTPLYLSGHVYNDVNGLSNNMIDGTATNISGSLYANLVDASGNMVASTPVAADGSYLFPVAPGNYFIRLSTMAGTVGAAPAPSLPAGWGNTGEGLVATGDGTVNGSISVTVTTTEIVNADFGIQRLPESAVSMLPAQSNPGGNISVAVPASAFSVSTAPAINPGTQDYDGGTVAFIRITAFPSNASSITINGTLYTAATFPAAAGISIPVSSNLPAQPILTDPVNGSVSVVIPFVAVDNAGLEDMTPGSVTIPFTDLMLSGTVYDDADGGTINGIATNTIGANTFYVNLTDPVTGVVIAVVPVAANGTYSFGTANGVKCNTSFEVEITNTPGVVNMACPPTGCSNTAHTAEGATSAGDGTADGSTVISLVATSLININFGLDQLCTADNKSYNIQRTDFSKFPPAGYPSIAGYTSIKASSAALTGYVAGGSLSGTDPEDCAGTGSCVLGRTFSIQSVNGNTKLYYDNGAGPVAITSGGTITSFDPAKLLIYGQDNTGTAGSPVGFAYKLVDAAGLAGTAATYSITTATPLALPAILSFSAAKTGTEALLAWNLEKQDELAGISIERSDDGMDWSPLAGISIKPGSDAAYSYTDLRPLEGDNYYRLFLMDLSGGKAYSAVRKLSFTSARQVSVSAQNGVIRMMLSHSSGIVAKYSIYSIDGRNIAGGELTEGAGADVKMEIPGLYIVRIADDAGNVVKTAKLILQ